MATKKNSKQTQKTEPKVERDAVLHDLAKQIRAHHAQMEKSLRGSLEHAARPAKLSPRRRSGSRITAAPGSAG